MAIKTRSKTEVATADKPVVETPSVTEAMTTVSFRTKLLLKKKAETVFDDLGITTSAAINMFLMVLWNILVHTVPIDLG